MYIHIKSLTLNSAVSRLHATYSCRYVPQVAVEMCFRGALDRYRSISTCAEDAF